MVSLNSVTIKHRNTTVFEKIDFHVGSGEFVFLIGKTGSGKSSLIKTLYGDLVLEKGTGSVVGFDLLTIKDKDIPLLRRKIGVVFQDFKLLQNLTIYENLRFVLKATGWKDKEKIKNQINQVVEMVSVKVPLQKYPHELSGGEQQKIAIARALLNEPELIIADEPTGNLDPETSGTIMELLKKLHNDGMTILMATHDYNMIIKFPGKIFKCENGSIFEVIPKTD
ncbi:MAG: phosphonate ABC transporter ATP-binding protein [Flavobacteriaceae bacterium]|nr:phosphonate ABC transporter ATP-binding protein [Flavobacteriaceae bacterium]|tara:strand:- start:16327 stop:16998 length:672 start_codon:yes stop_codon:yes gene_type:complete